MTIRLMLVDDHKILRDALRAVLEHEADIALVAETDDPNKVISLAREHQPKMIICGGSAIPRLIDFAAFREIADEVGAILSLPGSVSRRRQHHAWQKNI